MTDPTDHGPIDAPEQPASPTIPPEGEDRTAVLASYFRANQGRFTDAALARAATDAGYTQAEIDAAQALAEPGWQAPAASETGPKKNRWVVAGVAIAYIIVLYVAISASAAVASDLSGGVGLLGLLLGVVGWALLRNQEPSIAQGIGCGVVLAVVIPIVAIVVIVGICVATGSYPNGL